MSRDRRSGLNQPTWVRFRFHASFLVVLVLITTLAFFVVNSMRHVELTEQQPDVVDDSALDERRDLEPDEPLAFVKSTANATRNAMKSGDVRGVLTTFDESGATTTETQFRIRFSGECYRTETYPIKGPPKARYDRIIAVADKTGVCEGVFSERLQPWGCEGYLYQREVIQTRGKTPVWLQGKLGFSQVLFSEVLDKFDVRVERARDGRYLGEYQEGEFTQSTFETRPQYGNNFSQTIAVDRRGRKTITTATWNRADGVWYIEDFEQKGWNQVKLVSEKQVSHARIRIHHAEFNRRVPARLFSLGSLGFPDGTRITDHTRRKPRLTTYTYRTTEPNADSSVVREVDQLAVRQIR